MITTPAAATLTERLRTLAFDLWWTWSDAAQQLFGRVDPDAWRATGHAPLATLERTAPSRLATLAADTDFLAALGAVEESLAAYHSATPWFADTHPDSDLRIAYLCMEYGLHESLPWYSGGLGILAGDHVKAASDLGLPYVAVGIAWGRGYYRQHIAADGTVEARYPASPPSSLPVTDTGILFDLDLAGSRVAVRVWEAKVGRARLLLLDTDVDGNRDEDRALTANLYAGDGDWRIRQEVLLGVGGVHALDALGIRPTVWHLNEGHAAFAVIERARRAVIAGVPRSEAFSAVHGSTVFTTHTPVHAGNDRFDAAHVWRYLAGHAAALKLGFDDFAGLGREQPDDIHEQFCMTVLALRFAGHANGVARLHGETAREMWTGVYGLTARAVPITHVTNGVHLPTWTAPAVSALIGDHGGWPATPDANPWPAILERVDDATLWRLRCRLRRELVQNLRVRLYRQHAVAGADPARIAALDEIFSGEVLTIGFARRMATYKRAPLIFRDLDRIEAIVGDADRPMQLLFAGKAHPNDAAGHEFVARIHRLATRPALAGRVWMLADYDIDLGRALTAGCDVWLNNPVRPLEASGTSGMKAAANGVLNCSILDGWWDEAYDGANGWSLGGDDDVGPQERDRIDAEAIYATLERGVVPAFYDRDRHGIPTRWLELVRRNLAGLPAVYSTWRMVGDYLGQLYLPAHMGSEDLAA